MNSRQQHAELKTEPENGTQKAFLEPCLEASGQRCENEVRRVGRDAQAARHPRAVDLHDAAGAATRRVRAIGAHHNRAAVMLDDMARGRAVVVRVAEHCGSPVFSED